MKRQLLMVSLAGMVAGAALSASAGTRYESEKVSATIRREGKDLAGVFRTDRTLRADVYRVEERKNWRYESLPTARCQAVSGTGNGDWKGVWEASSSDDKALRLARAIMGLGDEGARQIVHDGYLRSRPRSWSEFQSEIKRADNQPDSLGYSRNVLEVYGDMNRRNLGYAEGAPNIQGNGDWKGYWDAGSSERPSRLAQAIRGLGSNSARALVNAGLMDQVPRDWSEFSSRILEFDRRFEMGLSYEVLVRYGRENMNALGYFDSQACTYDSSFQRVLKVETVREFDRSVQRAITIDLQEAPLLPGEQETLTLSFDGFNDDLDISSSYYRYENRREMDSSGAIIYRLKGRRQDVRPKNTVVVSAMNASGRLTLDLRDEAFDREAASVMGDLVVKIEIYQSKFFVDKKLGEAEVKIPMDGATVHYDAGMKPPAGSKVYAFYSIRRMNSKFYSSNKSDDRSSEKTRF